MTSAPNNQLTIVNQNTGEVLGTGNVGPGGTVVPPLLIQDTGLPCLGKPVQYVFAYAFTLSTNGTGTAQVHWTYGALTNCQTCDKQDFATLRRVAGP